MQDGGTPLPEFFKKNPKFEPINPDRHLKWFTDGKFDYDKWLKSRKPLSNITYPGISDFGQDTRSLNRNMGNAIYYDRTTGKWIYDFPLKNKYIDGRYIGSYPLQSEGFTRTSHSKLPKNHLMNTDYNAWLKQLQDVKAQQLKVPQPSRWQLIKNFLGKAGRVTGKVLNRLDPFPFMIAPTHPHMFQDPNMMPQSMAKGGEGPSVMSKYI